MRTKVVICWDGISGYMGACWHALTAQPSIDLKVISTSINAAFDPEVVRGVNLHLLKPEQDHDAGLVAKLVKEHNPAVVVVCGWSRPQFSAIAFNPGLSNVKFIMAMDTPWRGVLKQRFTWLKLHRFLGQIDRVVVSSERSFQYALHLGFSETRIRRGIYGFDYNHLAPLFEQRRGLMGGWPKRFLYVGRYAPEKAIDVLIEAYNRYRTRVENPWPLECCGGGPEGYRLKNQEGVEDSGFVQPRDLPAALLRAGVFVLASRYEPWGVVVGEALASGLPVLCTEACGAGLDMVRSCVDGLTVATDDAAALADGLLWMHRNYDRLPDMGGRGQPLAAAYSAQAWADRWAMWINELADNQNSRRA